jgi:hypothetical protein
VSDGGRIHKYVCYSAFSQLFVKSEQLLEYPMTKLKYNPDTDIPDLGGRVFLVTGGMGASLSFLQEVTCSHVNLC